MIRELGTVANGAHVYYELAAGVAMPFASRTGPAVAVAGWGVSIHMFNWDSFRDGHRRGMDKSDNEVHGHVHALGWPCVSDS